jgi:hypothetical protein
MAIQLNLTQGIDNYPVAYAKIVSQSSDNNSDKTSITYQVSVWKSINHKEANEPEIDHDRYEVTITDLVSTDFAGLYTHLLSQEKYKEGVMV